MSEWPNGQSHAAWLGLNGFRMLGVFILLRSSHEIAEFVVPRVSSVTRQFGGFLVAADPSVPVPMAFLTDVLPQLSEPAEIHVTLAAFRLAAAAGGIDAA